MGTVLRSEKTVKSYFYIPEQTGTKKFVDLVPKFGNKYGEKYPPLTGDTSSPTWLTSLAIRIENVKAAASASDVRCRLKVSFDGTTFKTLAESNADESGALSLTKNKSYDLTYILHYEDLQKYPATLAEMFQKEIKTLRCYLFSDTTTDYKSTWENAHIEIVYGWKNASTRAFGNFVLGISENLPFQQRESEDHYYYIIPSTSEDSIQLTGTITAQRDNPYKKEEIILQSKSQNDENWIVETTIATQANFTALIASAKRKTLTNSGTLGSATGGGASSDLIEEMQKEQDEYYAFSCTIKNLPLKYDSLKQYRILFKGSFDQWKSCGGKFSDSDDEAAVLEKYKIILAENTFHNYYTKFTLKDFSAFLKKEDGTLQDEIIIGPKGWTSEKIDIPIISSITIEKSDELNILNSLQKTIHYYKEASNEAGEIIYETEPDDSYLLISKDQADAFISLRKGENDSIPYGKLVISYSSVYNETCEHEDNCEHKCSKELKIISAGNINTTITKDDLIIPKLKGKLNDIDGNPTLTFYSTTSISLPSPNKIQIDLSSDSEKDKIEIYENAIQLGAYGRELKWAEGMQSDDTVIININTKTEGDYLTYSATDSPLQLKLIKSKELKFDEVKFYDAHAAKDYQKEIGPNDGDKFLYFYDNITITLLTEANELKEYTLIKMPQNSTPIKLAAGEIIDNNMISIDSINFEPFSIKTQLQLAVYDAYGGVAIITPTYYFSKLSPAKFKITDVQMFSHKYDIQAEFLNISELSNNDLFNLQLLIKHPDDSNDYAYIITKEGTLKDLTGALGESVFNCSDTAAEFVVKETKTMTNLMSALSADQGTPPMEIIMSIAFKNFPYCNYTVVSKDYTYNFSRVLKEIGNYSFSLESKRNYINGGENAIIIIDANEYVTNPYEETNYNYGEYFKPPLQLSLFDDINYYDAHENKISYVAPSVSQDDIVNFTLYGKIDKQYIAIKDTNSKLITVAYSLARWIKTKVDIIDMSYDFNNKRIWAKLNYDEYLCGSAFYENSEKLTIEVYDEALKTPTYYTLTQISGTDNEWEFIPPSNKNTSSIIDEQTSSDFYNFVVKATFSNTAGNTIEVYSSPYLISKLIDLTIRRGRIGINVPQDFEYDETIENKDVDGNIINTIEHAGSTLEIHQRESTQFNQFETIKIVGCKTMEDNPSGPTIGFYSADNHCYGRISATSANLTVMTIEEVKALFKTTIGGDTNE